jgi:hypothetical protein
MTSPYSGLSDAELDARLAQAEAKAKTAPAPAAAAAPAGNAYAGLSDAELDARIAAAEKSKDAPEVLQEMHPDFTVKDRFVVKNFASGDDQAVSYLQARHPNLEVRLAPNGQIQAKGRGKAEPYRVLDPNNGLMETVAGLATFRPEAWQDVADVGYDVASGVGTGLATGAAGVAGAAAGGVGAIPAAAAAGAGASMGFEGLKQGIGKALGIENNFDGTNLGIAGATGALSPLLLGTGATAGQLAKGALKGGLDDAGKLAMQQAQRGAIGRGVDAYGKPLLAKIGSAASGVSEEVLETYGKHADTIKRMENDPKAITNFTTETGKLVGDKTRAAEQAAWKTYSEAVKNSTDPVDMTPVLALRDEALESVKERFEGYSTRENKEIERELKKAFARVLRSDTTEISAESAAQLSQSLGTLAEYGTLKPVNMGVNTGLQGMTPVERQIAITARKLKDQVDAGLEAVLPDNAMQARAQYGEIANLHRRADALIRDPKQAFASLRNADKTSNLPNAELFHELDQRVGTDLIERSKILDTFGTLRKKTASSVPLSSGGATSTTRSVPLSAAGGLAGYYLGSQNGGGGHGTGTLGAGIGMATGAFLGSPAMMRRAIDWGLKGGKANQFLAPARSGVGGQMLQPAVEQKYEQFSPWLGIK